MGAAARRGCPDVPDHADRHRRDGGPRHPAARGVRRRVGPHPGAEVASRPDFLARLTDASLKLLPEVNDTSRCVRDVVLPTGDIVIHDEFDTGTANYKEFWWTMVGLSGESQNFDGNGSYVRFQPGGGADSVALGTASSPTGQLVGSSPSKVLGVRPKFPGKRPPYNSSVPCYKSKIPNVNGPWGARAAGEASP